MEKMALRSLDNALPAAVLERPKKVPKVTDNPRTPPCSNDENAVAAPPPKVAEHSVEYIASSDLKPQTDPETKLMGLLVELESKDWMEVCQALNDVRRFALFHTSLLLPILEKVMLIVVKAMKSPRSALCKTSIMTSADIFHTLGQQILVTTSEEGAFDNLLLQLLLKASQDKRFVCEEAEKALEEMAAFMSPPPLILKLQSYVNHRNPRVRAKAAVAIAKCISIMGVEIRKEFGLAKLLQVAAELLNDRLPEAREAARSIINSVYAGYPKDATMEEDGSSAGESWENFCSSNLPPISAQSVVKIISQ